VISGGHLKESRSEPRPHASGRGGDRNTESRAGEVWSLSQKEAFRRLVALGGAILRPRSPPYYQKEGSLRSCLALADHAQSTVIHFETSS
jgi:hypothetical protein